MRPIANFTFHAILAAAIAALATSSAAAGDARLTLGDAEADGGGHIDVESYSWGATNSGAGLGGWSKVDGLAIDIDPVGRGGAASSDMVMKGSKIGENAPAARTPPTVTLKRGRSISAFPKADVATAREADSGQASGKRQYVPAAPGSLIIAAALPACAAGTVYPRATLQTVAARYELEDVVVIRCASGSVSLNYARIAVR